MITINNLKHMKTKISVLLIALGIVSCNSGKNNSSNSTDDSSNEVTAVKSIAIENTEWTLTTLEGHEVHQLETQDQDIHFTLNPDGNRVSGYSGCNNFMGTYTLEEGNRIKFSSMASTRKACPESAVNESELLSVFEMADNFTIVNGELSLNAAKRAPLAIFKKSDKSTTNITETYWKLKKLEGKAVTMADNQEREIYFTLKTDDNRVTGFAGCNTFSGTYTLEEGNLIRFEQLLSTLKACPDVDVNESEILQVFELTDNYTIKDGMLSLNVGRKAPLAIFEAVYMD